MNRSDNTTLHPTMAPQTITTVGTGRRQAAPDLAKVKIKTNADGDTASEARGKAQVQSSTIRESVTSVSTEAIQTTGLQVDETSEVFEPDTDAPYHADERLQVKCGPEVAEDIVVEVVDAGGTVQGVQFGLNEEHHERLQEEAINAAMNRARTKAEHLAAVEGLQVTSVQEIRTTDLSTGMDSIVEEAIASGQDGDLHPAPIEVSEKVEVVFQLVEE